MAAGGDEDAAAAAIPVLGLGAGAAAFLCEVGAMRTAAKRGVGAIACSGQKTVNLPPLGGLAYVKIPHEFFFLTKGIREG